MVMDTGETTGFSASDHLEVLAAHAPELHLDVVLADPTVVLDGGHQLRSTAQSLGAEVVFADVADSDRPGAHDTLRLAAAYRDVVE